MYIYIYVYIYIHIYTELCLACQGVSATNVYEPRRVWAPMWAPRGMSPESCHTRKERYEPRLMSHTWRGMSLELVWAPGGMSPGRYAQKKIGSRCVCVYVCVYVCVCVRVFVCVSGGMSPGRYAVWGMRPDTRPNDQMWAHVTEIRV